MQKQYFIHRRGNLRHERAVLVSTQENGIGDWIDPQQLLILATGFVPDRYGCIISFALGLRDAGHVVTMVRQFHNRTQWREAPSMAGPPISGYYLLGLAYGFGQMDELIRQLRLIRPAHVHDILYRTADFYYDQLYELVMIEGSRPTIALLL